MSTRLMKLKSDETDIVIKCLFAGKLPCLFKDHREELRKWQVPMPLERLKQPLLSVFILITAGDFKDSVGKHHQRISRVYRLMHR